MGVVCWASNTSLLEWPSDRHAGSWAPDAAPRWAVRPFRWTLPNGGDGCMPTAAAQSNFLAIPGHDDLASVRHELGQLLWSRNTWSADDAELYAELTERELQLLSIN